MSIHVHTHVHLHMCVGMSMRMSAHMSIHVQAHGSKQLAAEYGALRFTVMRESDDIHLESKDERMVRWIETYQTATNHETHKLR